MELFSFSPFYILEKEHQIRSRDRWYFALTAHVNHIVVVALLPRVIFEETFFLDPVILHVIARPTEPNQVGFFGIHWPETPPDEISPEYPSNGGRNGIWSNGQPARFETSAAMSSNEGSMRAKSIGRCE